MSLPHVDKILRALVSSDSIPNGLIFYGEECDFLFRFSIDFIRNVNCSCAASGGTCANCELLPSLQHPDIKFIFPFLHLNIDDCCDNYLDDFATFFIKKKGEYNLTMWTEFISKQGKQIGILNNDIDKIKSFASLPAIIGKYKIIVMCFPETMNKSSSNMMLKMMEDPSIDKTLFLFLTNDFISLLPTVRSRCLSVFVPSHIEQQHQNNMQENFKKKEANLLDNIINWVKHCYSLEYDKINIINEKIILLGKGGVKSFLLTFLTVFNDFLYAKFNIAAAKYLNITDDILRNICDSLLFQDMVNITERVNREILNIGRNVNLKMMMFDLSVFIGECLNRNSH